MAVDGAKDRGASALEFALIVPLLVLLVFGMIDFGVRLSNQHALQSAVREGSRSAAVDEVGIDGGCTIVGATPPDAATRRFVCLVKNRIALGDDDTRVRIAYGPGGAAEGAPLIVCAEYPGASVSGVLPNFGADVLRARSVMRIEVPPSVLAYAETSLSGSWSGCSI